MRWSFFVSECALPKRVYLISIVPSFSVPFSTGSPEKDTTMPLFEALPALAAENPKGSPSIITLPQTAILTFTDCTLLIAAICFLSRPSFIVTPLYLYKYSYTYIFTSVPPKGLTESTWQLPSPKQPSTVLLKLSSRSSGTNACIVPANPPPCTL